MNLWVYTSKAPKNVVFKDGQNPDDQNRAYLYLRFGLSGNLMEDTSLTDPVIEIELYKGMRVYDGTFDSYHTNTDFNELLNVINKCNYIDMTDFETYHDQDNHRSTRCCFINEIEMGNYVEERDTQGNITAIKMIVRLYCHVDVLMTYRYNIVRSNKALVVAQEGADSNDVYYNTGSLATTIPETEVIGYEYTSGVDHDYFRSGDIILLTVNQVRY